MTEGRIAAECWPVNDKSSKISAVWNLKFTA